MSLDEIDLNRIDLNVVDLDTLDLGSYQLAAPIEYGITEPGLVRQMLPATRLDGWQSSSGDWHLTHDSDGTLSASRYIPERAMIAHFQNEIVREAQQAFRDNLTNVIMPQVAPGFTDRPWLKKLYDDWKEQPQDSYIIENGMIRLD